MKAWLAAAALACAIPVVGTCARPVAAAQPAGDGSAPLIDAIRSGNRAAVLELLEKHANVNARAADGSTALQWAVYRGDADLVGRLLEAGADVRAPNRYGATPMSLAAVAASAGIVRQLLRAGADADSPNAYGQTALMVVARTNHVDTALLLLRHGAHVNARETWRQQTALMWAAAECQPEMVAALLAHGADANARSAVNHWKRIATAESREQYHPAGGFTPLLYAARQGCLASAQALVRGGADIDLASPDGISPMLMATLNAHFDLAAWLLQAGANPNAWDKWGRAPLYAAADYDTLPVGGRPDRPSSDATTPLRLMQLLLAAGANPNMQLKLLPPFRDLRQDRAGDRMLTVGTTPLIRAAKAGDTEAVRLLLAHGADPNLPNSLMITPLMAAAGIGSTLLDTRGHYRSEDPCLQTAKLLVAAGASVGPVDLKGQSALYGAAAWGWNDFVRFLVANKAQLDMKDRQGFTPVDAALGRASGPVRFGITPAVHKDTAALLSQLMAAAAS